VSSGVGGGGDYRERVHPLAAIPSPTQSVWHLGPLPIHAYALCIIAGILFALWLGGKRWEQRGGRADELWDIGGWAIVFGIIGGRLYHLASDPELYFAHGKNPINAFKIWDGGLASGGRSRSVRSARGSAAGARVSRWSCLATPSSRES
jgi:hypothetical protein